VNKAQVTKAQKAALQLEENDFKACLKNKESRRVLSRIIEISGTLQPNTNNNPALLAKAEGSRSVGLYVLSKVLEYDPHAFLEMMKENNALNKRQIAAMAREITEEREDGLNLTEDGNDE
jgi:hypothetical protein